MRNLRVNLKKLFAIGGAAVVLMTMTGCAKKAECHIPTYHAHKYVNSDGYTRYFDSEYVNYKGYDRLEDYIELTKEDKDLVKYMENNNLLRIDNNEEQIRNAQEKNQPYTEYRYAYTYLVPIPHFIHTGKSTSIYFTFIPATHYSWTADANHSRLTGETRECYYDYTSYKIQKNENGKYTLVECPEHQDIISTKDEYPYIKENYYRVLNRDTNEVVDYEDMETDEKEHIQEEETAEKGTAKRRVLNLLT